MTILVWCCIALVAVMLIVVVCACMLSSIHTRQEEQKEWGFYKPPDLPPD